MEPVPIRFYLDENQSPEIVKQLARHGIDAIRGPLRVDDPSHHKRASALGRVLCTRDRDFVRLHAVGANHAGIIKGMSQHTIGDWVNYLRFVHSICAPEDMRNNVEHPFSRRVIALGTARLSRRCLITLACVIISEHRSKGKVIKWTPQAKTRRSSVKGR